MGGVTRSHDVSNYLVVISYALTSTPRERIGSMGERRALCLPQGSLDSDPDMRTQQPRVSSSSLSVAVDLTPLLPV